MATRIRITSPGIYGGRGMIPVGTEINLAGDVPASWAKRCAVIGDTKGKAPVTAKKAEPTEDRAALLKSIMADLGDDGLTASGIPDLRKVNAKLEDGQDPFTADERDALTKED